MFKKITPMKMFQNVRNQIEEAIIHGKLNEGEKLPSERELSVAFNASRGSVREALRVLEQKGLITIKPGANGGSFVKAITTDIVSDGLEMLLRYRKVSLEELAEFRETMEGIVAALAAERAEHKDILYIQHILSEARMYLEEGESHWEAFMEVDNRFHKFLVQIIGNAVFECILHTVYDNIHRYHDVILPHEEQLMRRNYEDLKEISEAIEKRDAKAARSRAKKHMRNFQELTVQYYEMYRSDPSGNDPGSEKQHDSDNMVILKQPGSRT